jgi:uncharacterized membrane protein
MKHRLPALDWMRGIVMIIMASDHASEAFNAGRLATDSALIYNPQQQLDMLQFLYRWISHLCAPTFLFLAGTALALSIERKLQRGVTPLKIDRDLLIRGLIILSVDLFIINWFWEPGFFLLQVMYAIGLAMILMIPLRRLSTPLLIAAALLILVLGEFFPANQIMVPAQLIAMIKTLLMHFGIFDSPLESVGLLAKIGVPDKILVVYPVLPWLAMMILGWALGRYLTKHPKDSASLVSPGKLLFISGCIALVVFVVLRAFNGFGNMGLLRLDNTLVQWLHVSKYPPSISFVALELGLMALILSGLFRIQNIRGDRINNRNPILLFGQTAFFFYVAHIIILETAGRIFGVYQKLGLLESTIATIAVLVILYPLCYWYRSFKAKHPQSLLRFI